MPAPQTPVSAHGLTMKQALLKAVRTSPPDHDPAPPKVVKAKRKKAARKTAKNLGE